MKYELFIGLRYLRAKRRQTFVSVITLISVAGVTVGVAALIIVLSGMVGVQEYMRDKILGFNAHLIVSSYEKDGLRNAEEARRKILEVPGVTGASPFIEGQLLFLGRNRSAGVMIRGIDPATVGSVMALDGASVIISGGIEQLAPDYDAGDDPNAGLPALAIGKPLADKMGVSVGDAISVIVAEGVLTPLGMRPKVKRFRVGCVFNFGFWEVDSGVALMHIATAQDLFNKGGRVDGIEVKTEDIYAVDETKELVNKRLGRPYFCSTWAQQQAQLFAALKMEQLLSMLILSLILLVAAFNIVSMLLMLVMEKYSDIAILKSMGATDGGIMRIFMTQGTTIGVIGSLAGVALGLFVCWLQMEYHILAFNAEVYQFSVVPMKVTAENVLGVSVGAMLLSFLTTIYPSWQAARMKPAESLRYE